MLGPYRDKKDLPLISQKHADKKIYFKKDFLFFIGVHQRKSAANLFCKRYCP